MQHLTIHAVGIDLPGDDFDYIPVASRQSQRAADIIIYAPGFDPAGLPGGRPVAESQVTVPAAIVEENRAHLAHWRQELQEALANGKSVLVFLPARSELQADDGSGVVDNYAGVPASFRTLKNTGGKKMKLAAGGDLLADYWREFGPISKYEVTFELDGGEALLTPAAAGVTVGAVRKQGAGTLFLLPPLEFDGDKFTYYDNAQHEFFWTDMALAYGAKLRRLIVDIDRTAGRRSGGSSAALLTHDPTCPPADLPVWVAAPAYRLRAEEAALAAVDESRREIADLQARISALQQVIAAAEVRLPEMQRYKGLLCHSGVPLQRVVTEALRLIGCRAEGDTLIEIDGERAVCCVTATESAAIDIEQILQLEQGVQEDFIAEGVKDYARGILFANPFSASPPEERGALFTPKALAATARFGFTLVHTADLFRVVQYLEGREDQAYAAEVRRALLAAEGVVDFPAPPAA